MRWLVGLEDGISLCADRCISEIPRHICYCSLDWISSNLCLCSLMVVSVEKIIGVEEVGVCRNDIS